MLAKPTKEEVYVFLNVDILIFSSGLLINALTLMARIKEKSNCIMGRSEGKLKNASVKYPARAMSENTAIVFN